MDQLLLELMQKLEAVGDEDESLYDTEVRERIGDPIFYLFIKPDPDYVMPDEFAMPAEHNPAIAAALGEYIAGALARAPQLGLNTFHTRLAAFQNGEIQTEQQNSYDDFFGWLNPELFDAAGNVIQR